MNKNPQKKDADITRKISAKEAKLLKLKMCIDTYTEKIQQIKVEIAELEKEIHNLKKGVNGSR